MIRQFFLFLVIIFLISDCSSTASSAHHHLAPVSNGWKDTHAASQTYQVQPEDTLYSIAFRFGLDYRQLASANHLSPPYHVISGQNLILLPSTQENLSNQTENIEHTSDTVITGSAAPLSAISSQPVKIMPPENLSHLSQPTQPTQPSVKNTPAALKSDAAPVVSSHSFNASQSASQVVPNANIKPNSRPPSRVVPLDVNGSGPAGPWIWPSNGPVIQAFSENYAGNKGIDIAGTINNPVKASASGKIVYCGTGLKGYGLLIIIKHNAVYLSAYAHNNKALVKEGDAIKQGQTIALMGQSDAAQAVLHFEIRQTGKPVDPLKLLPKR